MSTGDSEKLCEKNNVMCERKTMNVLLGLQSGSGTLGIQAVALVDAPEGGTCHP